MGTELGKTSEEELVHEISQNFCQLYGLFACTHEYWSNRNKKMVKFYFHYSKEEEDKKVATNSQKAVNAAKKAEDEAKKAEDEAKKAQGEAKKAQGEAKKAKAAAKKAEAAAKKVE